MARTGSTTGRGGGRNGAARGGGGAPPKIPAAGTNGRAAAPGGRAAASNSRAAALNGRAKAASGGAAESKNGRAAAPKNGRAAASNGRATPASGRSTAPSTRAGSSPRRSSRPAAAAPTLPAARIGSPTPGLLTRLAAAASLELQRRIPQADLDERDPDYIRDNLPALWLLCSLYFRADVRGLDRIPEEGPLLLVGNHSGGNVIADTFAFTLAFSTRFGVERRFHQLAHNLVLLLGQMTPMLPNLRKFGTVAASHGNAERALRAGAAVLVYPGGDYETHRPSWEGDTVDFGGRKGFIRLALAEKVPIVPVVSIGGQETALFLSRGEWLAKLLRLDRMFRLKVLPISLALPWGLNIGDMALHIPLPAKITIEVLDPIDLRATFGERPDIDEVYEHVVHVMQESLTRLAAERRFPVIG